MGSRSVLFRFVLGVAVVFAVVAAPVPPGAGPPGVVAAADESPASFSVVTQNLYLGADIGMALDLVPDLPAAAQAMWTQVQATDFPARAPALADIVTEVNPVVVALQEVTRWVCTPDADTEPVAVVDFTGEYLAALGAAGTSYEVASANGTAAVSPGFAIDPIIGATVVNDPGVFGPLFGVDEVSCGFEVEDVVLVRSDFADAVTATGFVTYDTSTSFIPGFIEVERGFAYADVTVGGVDVRFVSTHLESARPDGEDPPSALQARQLVDELAGVTTPVVVMGDFNAGPASDFTGATCEGRTCNSYLTMLDAGFIDAGPDATDPANNTFGAGDLLAGVPERRATVGLEVGNPVGFASRLDYVVVSGGVSVVDARVLGNDWPEGLGVWSCDDPAQLADNEAYAAVLGVDAPPAGACFASDHATVAAELTLAGGEGTAGGAVDAGGDGNDDSSGSWWWLLALGAGVVVLGGVVAVTAGRRRGT